MTIVTINLVGISPRLSYSKLKNTTSFNIQNSNSAKFELKKPEKLILRELELEILKQNWSMIHIRTRQFETR